MHPRGDRPLRLRYAPTGRGDVEGLARGPELMPQATSGRPLPGLQKASRTPFQVHGHRPGAGAREPHLQLAPCIRSLRYPPPASPRGITPSESTSAIDGEGIRNALLNATIEPDTADGLATAFDPELGGGLDLGEPAPEVARDDVGIVANQDQDAVMADPIFGMAPEGKSARIIGVVT